MSELLYTIATELADAVEDCLNDAGLSPPGRRFVDCGTAIIAPVEFGGDCESQLSVQVPSIVPSIQTSEVQRRKGAGSCALLWTVRFQIVMLRCHEASSEALPSPDLIDESAKGSLIDGWQITRGLSNKWAAGNLVPSFSFDCENVAWNPVTPLGPQGGIRGWSLPLDVSVHERYVAIGAA